MKSARPNLAAARILVCRPEPKASILCQDLQALGADARALPMIAIEPQAESSQSRALIQDFDQFGHIVVVSPIAAEFLLARLDTWWPQLPVGQAWYGLGPGTAQRLQAAGIHCQTAARGHDSEGLLQLPQLQQLKGEKVLLCAGEGGRALLGETFSARGARVEKLILYQRRRPDYQPSQLNAALVQFDPQVLIALSGETLNNLLALGQNTDSKLLRRRLVVPTERVAEQARRAGFQLVMVAPRLDSRTLAASLAQVLSSA